VSSASRAPGAASLAPYGLLSCAYFASIGLFNPYAPLWFQHLGYSAFMIGVMGSLQSWTRIATPYAWGWVADHWGGGGRRATLLRIASGVALLAALGLVVEPPMALMIAVVLLLFVGNAAIVPVSETLLAQRLATADGLDLGRYGRVRVWGSLGFLAAVVCFGALLQAIELRWFPWLMVAMCALLAVAAFRVPPAASAPAHAATQSAGRIANVLRRPEVAWFFASIFFTVLAHTSLYVYLSLYLVELGFSKTAVGVFWAVGVVVEIAFFWTQGRWFSRWSPHHWLMAAAALCALRFTALATLGGSALVITLTQCTHAITFAAHHAACISLLDRYFPGRLRGRGQALYGVLGYGLSGVLGALAGGAIAQQHGYASVFGTAAVVSLLAVACVAMSRRAAGLSQ
jgi:MFS transporter, PPP family, 3-phenylpropionic acid transporter